MSRGSSVRPTASGGVVLAGVLVLSSGCGIGDYRDAGRPEATAVFRRASCPTSATQIPESDGFGGVVGAGRVPDGFSAVRVVSCTWMTYPPESSAGRERIEMTEFRKSSVTSEFLASLDLPDQELARWSREACPAIGFAPNYLILVDAGGRAVIPRLPEAPCGEPRAEMERAIHELGLTAYAVDRFKGAKP